MRKVTIFEHITLDGVAGSRTRSGGQLIFTALAMAGILEKMEDYWFEGGSWLANMKQPAGGGPLHVSRLSL